MPRTESVDISQSAMNAETRPGRILDVVENSMAATATVLLVLITLSVCLEIVLRYFFNRPQVWVVELTEYGLVYITFLGSAWVLRNKGHVQVNVVVSHLNPRWQRRCRLFSEALGIAVSLLLTVFGTLITWEHYTRGVYKPTLLEVPNWAVLVVIPFGSAVLMLEFWRGFLSVMKSGRRLEE